MNIGSISKKLSLVILILTNGLPAFILYLITMPTTFVAKGDAAEFAVSVLTNGIPHPPGYPLFVLAGKLATFLPFGDKVMLVNATSAFFGALTCALVSLIVFRITKSFMCAVFAGFFLATSFLFWKYSIVSEVFTLNTFLAASIFYIAVTIQSRRGLYLLAFLCALSMSNHFTIALTFPAIFLILWQKKLLPKLKEIVLSLPLVITGFAPYLYLLWAGQRYPLQNWENPTDIAKVANIFFRKSYGGLNRLAAFDFPTSPIATQIIDFLKSTVNQFTIVGIALFIVGIFYLIRRKNFLIWPLLASYFLSGIFFYLLANAPIGTSQAITERFMLESGVFFAIIAACGAYFLAVFFAEYLKKYISLPQAAIAGLFLLIPAISILVNFKSINEKNNYFAKNLADDIFASTPQGAILLISGDSKISSVTYAYSVEKKRQDLAIIFIPHLTSDAAFWYVPLAMRQFPDVIFPPLEGKTIEDHLAQFIRENLKKRPVICACGFLRLKMNIAVPSKTVGITEPYFEQSPVDISLDKIEQEIDQNIKIYKNTSTSANFAAMSLEEEYLKEYAYAYVRLAVSNVQVGNFDEAERFYKKALSIDPYYFAIWGDLSVVYRQKGEFDKAVAALEKYIQMNPRGVDYKEKQKLLNQLKEQRDKQQTR